MGMFRLKELGAARRRAKAFAKQWMQDNPKGFGETVAAYKNRASEATKQDLLGAGFEVALVMEIVKIIMDLIAAWMEKRKS